MSDPVAKKKKVVSFSQFQNWYCCPHRWYLDYIKGLKEFEDSLNMSFGTAIHEAIQLFLRTLYKPKIGEGNDMEWCQRCEIRAERFSIHKYFIRQFKREVTKKNIPHTPEQFAEFVEDGKKILDTFKDPKQRIKFFPSHKYKLLAIEDELKMGIKNEVDIVAYLDVVLQDKVTGAIKIVDIKTATRGWNNYQMEDFSKTAQLVLYKALYSKKYNIPLPKIEVEFFILKRKIDEQSRFAQNRIQIFRPAAAQTQILEVINEFTGFVDTCFTTEGTHRTSQKYPKNPGKNKKNCKYCPHVKRGNCDALAEAIE